MADGVFVVCGAIQADHPGDGQALTGKAFFLRAHSDSSEENILRLANATRGLDSGFPRARYAKSQQQTVADALSAYAEPLVRALRSSLQEGVTALFCDSLEIHTQKLWDSGLWTSTKGRDP